MKGYLLLSFFFLSCILSCSHAQVTKIQQYELNDIHARLTKTQHAEVVTPTSIKAIQAIVRRAKQQGLAISISGGKHAMGGQEFGEGTINISTLLFNKVLGLDEKKGIVEVESGIEWPALIKWLQDHQRGKQRVWDIRQKQTGADNLTIGGALSANIHGRGLKMRPMIEDVESFTLIDPSGNIKLCSRTENNELFKLVIGGYGLFGVIATVKIRLAPTMILKREVQLIDVKDFIPLVTARIAEGFLYGDFQFATDPNSELFLRRGIYSLYRPISASTKMPLQQKKLTAAEWTKLLILAHTDKSKAFDLYAKYYLSTNGQLYRSDTFQMGVYVDDYHHLIEANASEMISEIYVPRSKLTALFNQLREDFRKNNVNVIYGTVRLIEKDNESYLAWAKENYACIVFNFHVTHTPEGIDKAQHDFRLIIDRALNYGGSYFLTYHRWARKDQVLKAYPQFINFLKLKKKYDPSEIFQSDWYRFYKRMFSQELGRQ